MSFLGRAADFTPQRREGKMADPDSFRQDHHNPICRTSATCPMVSLFLSIVHSYYSSFSDMLTARNPLVSQILLSASTHQIPSRKNSFALYLFMALNGL